MPADAFGDRLLRDRQAVHLVTDESGAVLGVVALEDLKQVQEGARATTEVGDVMREVGRVTPAADAFDTLALMNQADTSTLIVEADGGDGYGAGNGDVVGEGEVVGVLTHSDYAHAMTIRRGFQGAATGAF